MMITPFALAVSKSRTEEYAREADRDRRIRAARAHRRRPPDSARAR